MRRGTTPTNTFSTDIDLRNFTVFVTYSQGKRTVIEKTNSDITINEDNIIVQLTQADTLALSDKAPVYMQIRAVDANGTAVASNIMRTTADAILKDGEISV